jgi:hypothetical protein
VVLDVSLLTGSEKSYTAPDVLQQISTKLSGLPVVMINNINGLSYAILLSPAPMLQKAISGDPSTCSRCSTRLSRARRGFVVSMTCCCVSARATLQFRVLILVL